MRLVNTNGEPGGVSPRTNLKTDLAIDTGDPEPPLSPANEAWARSLIST